MTTTQTIELKEHRCEECGRYYAVESCFRSFSCPFCVESKRRQAWQDRDSAMASAASLRGVITRMKKGRK